MFPFNDIFPMIILNMEIMLREPIFWLVVILIGLQYRRMQSMREELYGMPLKSNWSEVGSAILFGLLGGLLGSLLMVFIGVTLTGSGLAYIWPLAILLMLVNARFICFAYAGGILALCRILFGFPQVNVSQVLALVAVLHMVESVLIFFSGHLGAVPSLFRDRSGRVVGGFTLQKFWPIPITALAFMTGASVPPGSIDMPGWWPLIGTGVSGADNIIYTLIPVVAALGYGDMAIARDPRRKSMISAGYLALYSAILLGLAVLSDDSVLLAVAAAIFSPLGHEAVIYTGRQVEMKDPPIYVPGPDGLTVLDVIPDSPSWRAGVRSGDVLLAVNGAAVSSRADLAGLMGYGGPLTEIEYWSRRAGRRRRPLRDALPGTPLGILPVPEGGEMECIAEVSTSGPLGRWLVKLWRRVKGQG